MDIAQAQTTQQHQRVCLTRENDQAPSSVSKPDLVFERVLEELERRQIARAQAHAFEIEQLDEVTRPAAARRARMSANQRETHAPHPFNQAGGQARRLRQRVSARAICRDRFHDPCPSGAARRAASGCGFPLRRSGRIRAPAPRRARRKWPSRPSAAAPELSAGKRKHVGRIVLAQELAVEPPQFRVVGDAGNELAAVGDACAQFAGELLESAAAAIPAGRGGIESAVPSQA